MIGPCLLGIEIGGTKLQLGLGRGDGRLLGLVRDRIDQASGASGIRSQIERALPGLLRDGGAERFDAIGVGFGGPVDSRTGRILRSHQITGWDDFPIADWLAEQTGTVAVAVHNDADTAALAESRFGAGVGLDPVLYVTIGSGIGGGLVVAERIYEGTGRAAIELGHLWIPVDGGEPRRLEAIASGWGIERSARTAMNRPTIQVPEIGELARNGDVEAQRQLDQAARALALALAQATTLLAPRRIILGGGVSLLGEDLWFGPIRAYLDCLCFEPLRGTFDVVPARLGEEVVVHGALALAADRASRANPNSPNLRENRRVQNHEGAGQPLFWPPGTEVAENRESRGSIQSTNGPEGDGKPVEP